jgi:predicted nucleic acid-binding protein
VIVVSDTSPIINLAAVSQLVLLRGLFGRVIVPQAVFDEIAVAGAGRPGAIEAQTHPWISTSTAPHALVAALALDLDAGEAEAVALALAQSADLLVIDERRGRVIATRLGLRVIGTLGVLIDAKQRGQLTAVKPVMDDLITHAGFWISQALYDRVLSAASEQP